MPHLSLSASRRQFLFFSGMAAATAAIGPPTASAEPRRQPNFVVILADDLGYGELGSYGQELIRTPNLDRLAAEGVRFTQAYAGAPVCAPSRCTLLTGLHTGHSTVRQNPENGPQGSLGEADVTFGQALRNVGYRTAVIGKWGFGPEEAGDVSYPHQRGFDEFFGYVTHSHAHQYYPEHLWHDDRKVAIEENAGGARQVFAPDLFADLAGDFVAHNRNRPFLLFYTPNLPHAPQDVPTDEPYSDRPWPEGDRAHAAQITRLDGYVGRLLEALRENGLDENTIVLFASDNGAHEEGRPPFDPQRFGGSGPLRGYKRNLYEGGIRTPLLAWSPKLLPETAGTVTDQLWAFWDLLPTLADFAGAAVPSDLDGISLRETLTTGNAVAREQPLYFYRREPGVTPRANAEDAGRLRNVAEALRRGDWKAVRFAPGREHDVPDEQWDVELYDLRDDVSERDDLAGRHPDIAGELVAEMNKAWVDPYLRTPHGLRITSSGGEVSVTLHNGSADRYADARLELSVSGGSARRLDDGAPPDLAPGESASGRWVITGGAGEITASALYTFRGQRHHERISQSDKRNGRPRS
ncbi:arylsulfatase, partial [Saccharopolyspora taberi]|uniref:arylsulfatase n=1 Tax=Saccharopolyspora taberi TaxID=60895 RepID=UPI0031DA1015